MKRIGILLGLLGLILGAGIMTQKSSASPPPPVQYVHDQLDGLRIGGGGGVVLDGTLFTDVGAGGTQTWISNGYPYGCSGFLPIVTTAGAETRTLTAPSFEGQRVVVEGKTIGAGAVVISGNSAHLVFSLNANGDRVEIDGVNANGTLQWGVVGASGAVGFGLGTAALGQGGPTGGQVTAHTGATYTFVPADFNSIHTTAGNANATVTWTLPAPQASFTGCWLEGFNVGDAGVGTSFIVTSTAQGTFATVNQAAGNSATYSTGSQIKGAGFKAVCDGTRWLYRTQTVGTAATIQ